jgi:amidase
VDAAVAAGVKRAADALRDAGYEVEEVDAPAVGAARDTWASLVLAEVAHGLLPQLRPVLGGDATRFLDEAIEASPPVDFGGYMMGFAARQGIARAWSEFFERYPLVLGPIATMQPFTVGFDIAGPEAFLEALRGLRLVVALNLLGLPAVVVPTGISDGLPQGVQVIGNRYREDLCLDAAEAIESRLGVITPIDPVT